ncbi:MAG: 50S ribosomal protein L9 [Coriobacteriia bacterium]
MKVILLSDVKGRGTEGDVIEVARGFAVNYLLPRKMAVEATPGNIKQLEARMHNIRKREVQRHSDAEGLAAAINGKTIVIEAKAGEEGKLFGSVTPGKIVEALAAQLSVDIDRRKLDAHGHIKLVGDHPVVVHLYQDVVAEVTVRVVREGGAAEAMAAPVVVEAAPVEVVEEVVEEAVEVEAVEETEEVEADAEVEEAEEVEETE